MNGAVRAHTLRAVRDDDVAYFVRAGDGYISLTPTAACRVEVVIARHRRAARDALLRKVHALDPRKFELLVSELLMRMGVRDVVTTRYSQDGGVDVRGVCVGPLFEERIAVQVKRVARPLGSGVVRALRGDLADDERGVVVTMGDFQPAARSIAQRFLTRPVSLVDGTQLAELLIAHRLGARVTETELVDVVGFDVQK
jgi:restriction system protein